MVLLSIEKDQSNIKHKTERCYFIKIEPKPQFSAPSVGLLPSRLYVQRTILPFTIIQAAFIYIYIFQNV